MNQTSTSSHQHNFPSTSHQKIKFSQLKRCSRITSCWCTGQGAWCWYKLAPRLRAAGHRVTALDMAASGVDTTPLDSLRSFADYNAPLLSFMASLPACDKVVLVGHSLGGMNIAFAMERFPAKVSAAVFVSAIVPDAARGPAHFVFEILSRAVQGEWLDCKFSTIGGLEDPLTVATFGPEFLRSMGLHLSPVEDLELELLLARPMVDFSNDLAKAKSLTKEGYGSIRRVYVVCKEDKILVEETQRLMIEGGGLKEIRVLEGADHAPMISKPQELCDCLLEIVGEIV